MSVRDPLRPKRWTAVVGLLVAMLSGGCASFEVRPTLPADDIVVDGESFGQAGPDGVRIEALGYSAAPTVCVKREGAVDVVARPPLIRRNPFVIAFIGGLTLVAIPAFAATAFFAANPTVVPGILSDGLNYGRVVVESPTWATVPAIVFGASLALAPLVLAMGPMLPGEEVIVPLPPPDASGAPASPCKDSRPKKEEDQNES